MARLKLEDIADPSPMELGRYRGEWVAVHGGKVIAHGLNPEIVMGEATKITEPARALPMIYRIPKGDIVLH